MNQGTRFQKAKIGLITMHGKGVAVVPVALEKLDAEVTEVHVNTDQLGTFTGEIERKSDPLTTCRQKIDLASDIQDFDFLLASEGSFGPDPITGLITCNEEWMVAREVRTGREWKTKLLSYEINFGQAICANENELLAFAEKYNFPEHALILSTDKSNRDFIIKGIQDRDELIKGFYHLQKNGSVLVETDMRAMMNPTRMRNIALVAQQLFEQLTTFCPSCSTPGWSIVKTLPGLPCAQCGTETRSVLSECWGCIACSYQEYRERKDGKKAESPMYCDWCNP